MQIQDAKIELHVHPFLEFGNKVIDIVQAMEARGISVIGLERFNNPIYQEVKKQAQQQLDFQIPDETGIILPKKHMCIFNAREYDPKERIHLVTVGYSHNTATPETEMRAIIDAALQHDAFVFLDHPFVDNEFTRTAGHISEEKAGDLEALCKEYPGQIAVEWNGYCIPWMRRALMYVAKGLHKAGKVPQDCTYSDVNKKAEELVNKLQQQGYNVPLIADTDVHARMPSFLHAIGTAHFTATIEGERAKDVLASMKKAVFEGKYENTTQYVSSAHLLLAFCLPQIIPGYSKPRA